MQISEASQRGCASILGNQNCSGVAQSLVEHGSEKTGWREGL